LNPQRSLHGSLYKSLRTNLPRKLMAFRDFPFEAEPGISQFVSHERVLTYLNDFAEHFGLYPVIEFTTSIESVKSVQQSGWHVQSSKGDEGIFDAVIVGNGHYSKPRVPEIPGMEGFKGQVMHSHNYRTPDSFAGKRVALFGAAASALDISLELNQVAEQVYWCAEEHAGIDVGEEIQRCGMPEKFESRNLKLENGEYLSEIDAFIFCTGYHYRFRFLEEDIVSVTDHWVHSLYLDLIPPEYPSIAFVGLPFAVIPFPLFELQVKWFTRQLVEKYSAPSKIEMRDWCEQHHHELLATGRKQRTFHKMGAEQYAYMNLLAEACGADPLPEWFQPLAEAVRLKRLEDPVCYRDYSFNLMET
jgi:hypothetical protein